MPRSPLFQRPRAVKFVHLQISETPSSLLRVIGILFIFFNLFCCRTAHAALFAELTGVVHDAQHHPLEGAQVEVKARASAFAVHAESQPDGSFRLRALPFGEYLVTVTHPGFSTVSQTVTLASGTSPVMHLAMSVAGVTETVSVDAMADELNSGAVTPTTLLNAQTIQATPGADLSHSLAMITDYVPGAYITHDMLHLRGGHQVSWLLDGVQIPNTNIASNLGPQIDPRDIDYLQIDRGSYSADLGDRTYGIFDVNPKSGFERDREGELIVTAGSALQTDNHVSFGDHSQRAAYYASVDGGRSDYGLSPPGERPIHDAENGYGGFGSILFNRDADNQFRLLTQLRRDYFQIPYDPDPNSYENQLYDTSGLRDAQHETDSVVAFTWSHSFSPAAAAELSPFFHGNSADYQPGAADVPNATTSDRSSRYAGLQASASGDVARQRIQGGVYAWGQHDTDHFGVSFADGSAPDFSQSEAAAGGLIEEYISDTWKPFDALSLTAGLRESYFSGGGFSETATYPRFGVALQIPRLKWTLRAFYGHFYQPPPLVTVAGPELTYAQGNNTSFAPLPGERDEEHQFGVQIPFRGWVLDIDTFQTEARNFLDHSNLGESSIYVPVSIAGALIQGWETTLRSPPGWRRGGLHLAYSNQIARQRGAITGGLVCYPLSSPDCDVAPGYTPLDHDQRNTLNAGGAVNLPGRTSLSTNVYYGSGFTNGYPGPPSPYNGAYLPSHTTFDLELSHRFGENVTASLSSTNVANRRVLLDNSLTFGGFHENDPRQIFGEVRYRFHY